MNEKPSRDRLLKERKRPGGIILRADLSTSIHKYGDIAGSPPEARRFWTGFTGWSGFETDGTKLEAIHQLADTWRCHNRNSQNRKEDLQDSQNPVHPVYPVREKYVTEFMNRST